MSNDNSKWTVDAPAIVGADFAKYAAENAIELHYTLGGLRKIGCEPRILTHKVPNELMCILGSEMAKVVDFAKCVVTK